MSMTFCAGAGGRVMHEASSDVTRKALLVSSMHIFLCLLASLLLLAVTGCVESDQPLTEPEKAAADEDIVGLWQAADDNLKRVSFERVVAEDAPKGLLRVRFPNQPDGKPHFLWATNVGDVTFLNVPISGAVFKSPLNGGGLGEYRKWAEGEKRPVWLLMLKREGDQMVLRTSLDGDHQFAGDPQEAQRALLSDPNKYFSKDALRLVRVSDVAINGLRHVATDEDSGEEPSRPTPENYTQQEAPDQRFATLELERLTPEQARQLVTQKNAEQFGDPYLVLEVTELDAETARQLAMFEGHTLGLSRLATLDAATAKALAEFKGFVWLDGLTSLDPLTAKEIAGFRGDTKHPLIAESPTGLKGDTRNTLKLDGLKTLDANTAAALAQFEGRAILLQGVTTLDAAAAESLAQFHGEVLYLTRLKLRDTNVAKALAHFNGKELHIQLPDAADANIAKALAEFDGELPLLEPEVVTKVRSYRARQDTSAPPNSDVRMALFAMREAAQSHLVCDALRVMSYSKVEPEEIDKISRKVIEGMKEISIPLLKKQIEESSGDQEARGLLEAIGGLQHLVVAEAEAIRHYATVDASPATALEVFEATRAYQKRASELMQQLDGKGE